MIIKNLKWFHELFTFPVFYEFLSAGFQILGELFHHFVYVTIQYYRPHMGSDGSSTLWTFLLHFHPLIDAQRTEGMGTVQCCSLD